MEEIFKPDTLLEEILKRPNTKPILEKYHLPCLMCPMAAYEIGQLKIGDVAKMYGIDLNALLKELNEIVREKTNSEE